MITEGRPPKKIWIILFHATGETLSFRTPKEANDYRDKRKFTTSLSVHGPYMMKEK